MKVERDLESSKGFPPYRNLVRYLCEIKTESHYGIGFTPQHLNILIILCNHYCLAFPQAWGILSLSNGIQMHWCKFKNSVHIPSTDPYMYSGIHHFPIRTCYAYRLLKRAFRVFIFLMVFLQKWPLHLTFTYVIFRNNPLSVMRFFPYMRA